jgi:hypothetical protein
VAEWVSVALGELIGEVHEGLLALAVGAGLQVLTAHRQLRDLRGWDDRRLASGMRRSGDRRCAVLQGVSLPSGDHQPLCLALPLLPAHGSSPAGWWPSSRRRRHGAPVTGGHLPTIKRPSGRDRSRRGLSNYSVSKRTPSARFSMSEFSAVDENGLRVNDRQGTISHKTRSFQGFVQK